ncbi:ABC transporter permease [Oceanithermus sp.]
MFRFIAWEIVKMLHLRSVRLGLVAAFVLPIIWTLAPGLKQAYGLVLVSGWQVPSLALLAGMEFLYPFLVAMAAAEVLGAEVSMGTLKPLLLRPLSRTRFIAAKLIAALAYPFLVLGVSLLAALLAGLPHGLGGFFGGTGLGEGGFAGVGYLSAGAAFAEILRAYFFAALTLLPIAALSLMFAVWFNTTTAAALGAIATVLLMRLLIAFPSLKPLLLTTYLDLYLRPGDWVMGLSLLFIYTLGFGLLAVLLFERKDV